MQVLLDSWIGKRDCFIAELIGSVSVEIVKIAVILEVGIVGVVDVEVG